LTVCRCIGCQSGYGAVGGVHKGAQQGEGKQEARGKRDAGGIQFRFRFTRVRWCNIHIKTNARCAPFLMFMVGEAMIRRMLNTNTRRSPTPSPSPSPSPSLAESLAASCLLMTLETGLDSCLIMKCCTLHSSPLFTCVYLSPRCTHAGCLVTLPPSLARGSCLFAFTHSWPRCPSRTARLSLTSNGRVAVLKSSAISGAAKPDTATPAISTN
jgi:hypothetical protein